MNRFFKTALCSSVALAALAASVPAVSQEITATIRGSVTAPDGSVIAGATIVVTDTRTGNSSRTSTNNSGGFSVRSLDVGGPFTVRVSGTEFEDALVTGVFTKLGSAISLDVQLQAAEDGIEEIVISAKAISALSVAIGPSSSFNLGDIQALPSISRQIRDVIRIDPRVNISRSSGGEGSGINCNGASGRVNSFTIDGVRAQDPFGLNASGNVSRSNFPIPFDSVAAASVEFSPVDVEYGQFTGCNVNVVSKSGSNEFHGSAFMLYSGDTLSGKTIEGEDRTGGAEFDRYNFGAELGGPIIKDKLFFYAAYEENTTSDVQSEGPAELGFANPSRLSLDEVNRIKGILENQYGRNVGDIVRTLPNTSKSFIGRIDYNLNDYHKITVSYSQLKEDRILGDDINTGRGNFTFEDNFQSRGAVANTYRFALISDWSDNFSTELRVSRQTANDVQSPVLGGEAQETNVPRIAIGPLSFSNEFFGQDFASGPGIFRSANQLDTQIDQIKFVANYTTGSHTITAGYELDSKDVFNLFIINATGTIFFDNIDALEAGTAREIRAGGTFTTDPVDGAASFKRDIHSFYLQDEWQVSPDFTLTAGLRYDYYKSNDQPNLNPAFAERYGFSNQQVYDGLNAFQPRIGFVWDLPDDWGNTTVTGGFAIFSGGDPTVWFSNSYQNFGGAIGVGRASRDCTAADLNVLAGGFSGIPACVFEGAQNQALQFGANVAAVDPDFKLPTQNRFSLGVSHYTENTGSDFFDDWQINLDWIYSDSVNAPDFVDLSLTAVGTAPDGRPIFEQIDPAQAGCNATFSGIRSGFSGVTPECVRGFSPGDGFGDLRPDNDFQDILLTNAVNGGGYSFSFAAQFQKEFQVTETGTFDFRAGYAYTDTQIGNPGTSSTAGSNFEEVTTTNFNNVPLGRSYFSNKHNITIGATYRTEFFDDLTTSFTAFFRARSGRPLSYVFSANSSNRVFGDSDNEARSLLYVPTGPDDPLVNFEAGFDTDAFFAFLAENDLNQYAGGSIPKTTKSQPWATDIDLRISQEIRGFFGEDKFEIFMDFENFLNFLNDSSGVNRFIRSGDVAEGISVVDARLDAATNRFNFRSFTPSTTNVDVLDTLWRIQVGIRYKF
jgi:outer membrane receptor protein involved in Fe transport